MKVMTIIVSKLNEKEKDFFYFHEPTMTEGQDEDHFNLDNL